MLPPEERTPPSPLLRVEIAPRTFALVAAAGAAFWLLVALWPLPLAVIVALMLVGALEPLVDRCERMGAKRGVAIALVVTAILIGAAALALLTIPPLIEQAKSLFAQAPALREKAIELLERQHATAALGQRLRDASVGDAIDATIHTAVAFSPRLVEAIGYGVSSVFLAIYLMVDRDRMRGVLFALVPRRRHVDLSRVLVNLEEIVGGYVRGQIITSALAGAFTFAVLAAFHVPNAVALAAFAALADVLPYVGALLACGPAALAALGARGPGTALAVGLLLMAYQEFESRIIVPRVYGRALRLPSSMVLLALLAGGQLMGIVGALLALPLAAAGRMLIEQLRVAMPGEPVPSLADRVRDGLVEDMYEQRTHGESAERAAAEAIRLATNEHEAERHKRSDGEKNDSAKQ